MVAQEANRCHALAAAQVPTEGSVGRLSGVWHKDCRVFFAADMAVLLTAGAAPFCIPRDGHAQAPARSRPTAGHPIKDEEEKTRSEARDAAACAGNCLRR